MGIAVSNPTKIIVLDGYTLTRVSAQGRLKIERQPQEDDSSNRVDWSGLAPLGEVYVYDRTAEEDILQRCEAAQIVLTNKALLMRPTLEKLPELRYIGVTATGVNNVDLDAARDMGITVTNVPSYSTESVAQHVFALLLELINHTHLHAEAARDGTWSGQKDFSYMVEPVIELAGRSLGIVGVGAIGSRVARIGSALKMRVLAAHQRSMARVKIPGVDINWLPLERMLACADVVSLHCPLNPQTHHLINAQRLTMMKPSAILINTGRGPLVDEHALAAALSQNQIAGAGLDVLSHEPPPGDHPLLKAPRCVVTPHIAWASQEARQRLMAQVVGNVKAFLDGRPVNVVT